MAFIVTGFACLALTVESESRGAMLWADENCPAKQNVAVVNSLFDAEGRTTLVHVVPRDGGNAITPTHIRDLFTLSSAIRGVMTPSGKTLADICERRGEGFCDVHSILDFWQYGNPNVTLFDHTIGNDSTKLQDHLEQSQVFPGTSLQAAPVWASLVTNFQASPNITGTSLKLQITLKGEIEGFGDCANSDCEQRDWEKAFLLALGGDADSPPLVYKSLVVYKVVESSFDDELARNVGGDVSLFVMTYAAMCIFCCAVLGSYNNIWLPPYGCVQQRWGLGTAGACLVFSSMGAGYGFASLTGAKFTTLQMILPFVLLGIGVDDMLILTFAFDAAKKAHPDADIPELCALAVRQTGISITLTSITAALAFLLGRSSKLPAIQYFGTYACTSIIADYILQMTAFVAMLSLDERRQRANKLDFLCCVSVHTPPIAGDASETPYSHETVSQKMMRTSFGPMLLYSMPVKIGILLCFFCISGLCGYLYGSVGIGFDLLDLTPDQSYVKDYFEMQQKLTGSILSNLQPNLVYTHVAFHTARVQAAMIAFEKLVNESSYIIAVAPWLPKFYNFINSTQPSMMVSGYYVPGSAAAYGTALKSFLNLTCPTASLDPNCRSGSKPNAAFSKSVAFHKGSDEVAALAVSLTHKHLMTSEIQGSCLTAMEELTASAKGFTTQPFIFDRAYIFFDGYRYISQELIITLLLALAAVGFVCLICLDSVKNSFVVVLSLVLVDVDLLGILKLWGLQINSITVINLVMAIGLMVDYSLHIVHCFGQQEVNAPVDDRVINGLAKMGPSVLTGATTTMLGIIPLAAAGSEIFRVFFRMMLSVVVLGAVHGFCFAPVMLSVLGNAIEHFHPSAKEANNNSAQAPPDASSKGEVATLRNNFDTKPEVDSSPHMHPPLTYSVRDSVCVPFAGYDTTANRGVSEDRGRLCCSAGVSP